MTAVVVPLWAVRCRQLVTRPVAHQGRRHGCPDRRCFLSADLPQRLLDELPLPEPPPPPPPPPFPPVLRRTIDALVGDGVLDPEFADSLHAEIDQLERRPEEQPPC